MFVLANSASGFPSGAHLTVATTHAPQLQTSYLHLHMHRLCTACAMTGLVTLES